MNNLDFGNIDYKTELLRKSIHLTSLSIPFFYYFISLELGLMILIPITFFSISLDLLRNFHEPTKKFIFKWFGFMLRDHEMNKKKVTLTGASFVFLSALISAILFPKVIFLTAFSILIISDTTAALVGRKIGKTKFLRKSLEGTLAFIVSSFIVVMLSPKVIGSQTEFLIGYLAGIVAGFAENLSFGWADDNFVIPLSAGFTMWILYSVVFPNVDLILKNVPN